MEGIECRIFELRGVCWEVGGEGGRVGEQEELDRLDSGISAWTTCRAICGSTWAVVEAL